MEYNKAKLALVLPNLASYNGGVCAYVRYMELEDKFYIGVSKYLLGRYKSA